MKFPMFCWAAIMEPLKRGGTNRVWKKQDYDVAICWTIDPAAAIENRITIDLPPLR
jgi:hypothetical protein